MVITSPKRKADINIPGIKQVNSLKYLGIYIDDKLNWKA